MYEMKTSVDGINFSLDIAEENLYKLEDSKINYNEREKIILKNKKSICGLCGNLKWLNICVLRHSENEEREIRK